MMKVVEIQPAPASATAANRAHFQCNKLSANARDRLLGVLSPFLLLLLWEVAARTTFIDTRFFPAPSSIFQTLLVLASSGELWSNTWASLQRMFWGFLVGGVPALVIGVLMGLYRPLRALIDPLIAATYPVPKSALMPLLLLIFGLGEGSKIAMVAIGVFFPVLINAVTGVREINKIYLDVGNNFKASRWQVFRTIAVPGALPFIMTGIKLGIGMGLILIALAEMVGASSGLGYMIWNAWEIVSVETMYVGLLMIALIGFVFTLIMDEIERIVVPWKSDR
jgi:ABC-type nitrate/sulfonate/bicarbonate transport system permease component